MTRRVPAAHKLRAVLLALVMSATSFGLAALPVDLPVPLPLPEPEAAQAGFCASGPNFTGRLTADSSSTTALSRTTSANTAAYISNVVSTWSCNAYFRYSGVTWNTTSTAGTFDWGLLGQDTAGCNWLVGSTDYLKANNSTDCPDSDAEYAMVVTLGSQGVYQRDVAHNSTGDFSYVHSDCGTNYGAEAIKTGQTYDTGITGNRPGANCDPIALDDTATAQTVTFDSTNPTVALTAPASGGPHERDYTTYQPVFNPSDNVAGFGGSYLWSLQRQIAAIPAHSTCGSFANDTAAGNLVTGTAQGSQTAASQTLANGKCYRWVLSAEDQNGNGPVSVTSGSMLIDQNGSTVDFTNPNDGTETTQNTTSFAPTWTATDAYSGVASMSLQRQRVADTAAPCPASGYTNDGSASSSPSGTSYTLTSGYCYQWVLTVTDGATNPTVVTSGKLFVDAASPSTNFTTPNEGTMTIQNATTYNVAWTESYGSGQSFGSRSLQRWRADVVNPNSCLGVTWVDDPTQANITAASPHSATGLLNGYCYRWTQTLTNSPGGKTSVTTSGHILVDTSSPTGSIASPTANTPLAGDVEITGTATDGDTFKEYQLEYGAGSSPSSWTSIGTYTSQVTSTGTLATWSTGSLNGAYTIRLTVRDNANNTASQTSVLVYLENAERGTESYFTRIPYDLGGGYSLDVGVHNGEARLSRDLFEIPSYGPAQALSPTYSSLETTKTGRFGYGWNSNLTQYVTFESGFVVWHRGDGGRVPFGNVGGTWTPLAGHLETLSRGGSEDTVITKDQTKYVFENSGAGRLKRIEDRFGNALTLAWTASSATATDASGRATTIAIDSTNDRITGVTDSAGRAWGFGYSTGHDLTSITEPDPDLDPVASTNGPKAAAVTTLTYDASHRLTGVSRDRTPAGGSAQTITWAIGYASGKATTVTDPIDLAAATPGRNKLTYGAGTTTVERLREYGASPDWDVSTYLLDQLGRVTDSTDAAGYVTSREYNEASNLTRIDVPVEYDFPTESGIWATTTYTYDGRGNVVTETKELDPTTDVTTAYLYNATNDLLTVSEADDNPTLKLVTRHTYDGAGHRTSTNVNCTTTGTAPPTDASTCTGAGAQDASTNLITTYTYTANDQLETATDPLGIVTKHAYDGHGNETELIQNYVSGQSATAERNVTTTTEYDATIAAGSAGLPTRRADPVASLTDPITIWTTYTYDALGRRVTEVLPGDSSVPGLTTTTAYDELGNVLTETQAWTPIGGGSASRLTTYAYDLVNREADSIVEAGATDLMTETDYDAAGNAVSTLSDGVTTARTFDGLGRIIEETIAGGTSAVATTEHAYDAMGNETQTWDATDRYTSRGFDFAGRIVQEIVVSGEDELTTVHTYDALGRELTMTAPDGTATTNTYDRAGRQLTTATDGLTTTNAYDRGGNVVAMKGPDGPVTTTMYDPLGRATDTITNCTDSGTTQPAAGVACGGAGTANSTTNLRTRTYYDAAGTTIAVQDSEGATLRTIPNVRGQAAQAIANCTDSGTTPTSNPATCVGGGDDTETTNVTTTYAYDGTGAVLGSVAAAGTGAEATTETYHDAAGRVQAVKDPRGTITRTLYDAAGRVTSTVANCTSSGTTVPTTDWQLCTGAGSQDGTFNLTTTYAYDDRGNQVSVTAPNGRLTTTVYDAADRVTRRIDNDVVSPSDPDEDVTTDTFYDDAGRQAAIRTATADGTATTVTRFVFDDAGRVVREIRNCTDTGSSPPAAPELCGGAEGTSLGTEDATTNVVTTYAYDARGNRIRLVGPDPSAAAAGTGAVTTQYAYDAADRLCRVVENATGTTDLQALTNRCSDATQTAGTTTANVSTRYTYDGAGNTASMVDANGNATTYGYDAAGRMTSRTDALAETVTWAYDDLGNRVRQTNRVDPPLANSVTWTYDGAGRVLTRTADSVTTTYTYDENGNRLTASDGTLTITATYDRLNRVLTVDDEDAGSTADTTYTYSLTSPSWTDPTGTYGVTLDAFDRPVELDDPVNGNDFSWAYGPAGAPLSFGQPNGNTTTYAYDPLGRQTGRVTAAGATHRLTHEADHNRAGSIVAATEKVTTGSDATTTYAYDPLGRLTGWTPPTGSAQTYGWDEVPNRTSLQVGGGSPVTTTYDAANRPTSTGYASDDDGRLTARPDLSGQTFVWDDLGRLTAVKNAAGTVILAAYSYDPLDRLRLVDRGTSDQVRFRHVGITTSVAQVIDHDAGSVSRHIGTGWAGQRLLDWTGSGSDIRIYGTNGHHDTTWTASSAGAVTATLRYDPWGNLAASTGTLPDFRFQGSWFDTTTELSWVVTRWYAPAQGRFISEDSLLGEPARPASRHLYAYGEGEPIGRWDPDGRETMNSWEWDLCRRDLITCAFVKLAVNSAGIAERRWPVKERHVGRGGAARHCVWQCLLTYRHGLRTAEAWAAAHEMDWWNQMAGWTRLERLDLRMDLHNNRIGQLLGVEMRKQWFIFNDVPLAIRLCEEAINRGWLRVVKRDRWGRLQLVSSNS